MNFYEEKQFTDDELIVRVMDKEAIKNLMGRRAYYYANNQRRRELDELWVSAPDYQRTASYGRNWGYYTGMDSIARYYVIEHNRRQYRDLEAIRTKSPEVELSSWNLGYGTTAFHEVTTPMLYIAGDGKTARGLWYVPGQETIIEADGTPGPTGPWTIWRRISSRKTASGRSGIWWSAAISSPRSMRISQTGPWTRSTRGTTPSGRSSACRIFP